MHTTRRWARGVIAFIAVALAGCDGAGGEPLDAGLTPLDAAAPLDAATPIGATFLAATLEGEGPWGRWGYQVAALDAQSAIVLGGTDASAFGGTVFEDAWRVRVSEDGSVSATRIDASGPAPRYCGCMAWDPTRARLVVYGGRDLSAPTRAPETWELDVEGARWRLVEGATEPPGTVGCAMAYLPSTEQVYLFGGGGTGGFDDSTFRYDAAAGAWVELDAPGPLARYDGYLFPSRDGAALLLFGGSYGARGAAFYADLWRFDPIAETWSELALPDGPRGRRTPWIVHDPARDGLYIGFGFDGEMEAIGDLWHLDLDARAWRSIEIAADGPVARGFALALPGGAGALGLVLGGNGGTRALVDGWRLVRAAP